LLQFAALLANKFNPLLSLSPAMEEACWNDHTVVLSVLNNVNAGLVLSTAIETWAVGAVVPIPRFPAVVNLATSV
jgi:hypothetical protein